MRLQWLVAAAGGIGALLGAIAGTYLLPSHLAALAAGAGGGLGALVGIWLQGRLR